MNSALLGSIGWPVIDRLHIGSKLAVSPHGLFIAVGFLLGAWWLLREGARRGLSVDHMNTMIFLALIGAVIGSRLFYVIAHYSEFNGIGDMVAIWRGGISLLGGIAGAVLINVPFMRKYGYRFFQCMDSAAIAMAFGISVGRIGDLIIGDHLGKPTSWALAFRYEGGTLSGFQCVLNRCAEVLVGRQQLVVTKQGATLFSATGRPLGTGVGVHQTALYDMIGAFVLFLFLYWLARKPRHEGVLFAVFALWYGSMRIVTDFLRVDKRFYGLTGSQWTSIAAVVISAILLIKWSRDKDAPRTPALLTIKDRREEAGTATSTDFVPPKEPSADR